MISLSSLSVKSYDFAIDKLAFVTSSTTLFVTFNSIGFFNPNAFASNLLIIIEPLSQDTYIFYFPAVDADGCDELALSVPEGATFDEALLLSLCGKISAIILS